MSKKTPQNTLGAPLPLSYPASVGSLRAHGGSTADDTGDTLGDILVAGFTTLYVEARRIQHV